METSGRQSLPASDSDEIAKKLADFGSLAFIG